MKIFVACLLSALMFAPVYGSPSPRPLGGGEILDGQHPLTMPMQAPKGDKGIATMIFQTGPDGNVLVAIARHGKPGVQYIVVPVATVSTFAPIDEGRATSWTCWIYEGRWVGIRTG